MRLYSRLISFALFCTFLSNVSGHDDNEMSMMDGDGNKTIVPVPYEPSHLHGVPILERPDLTVAERLYWTNYNTTTYFTTELGNRSAFNYHTMTVALIVIFFYPICLALNSIGSNWYLPALTINLIVVLSSLLSLSIFAASFPEDWYPNNVYRKTSWILFFLIIIHFVSALVSKASKWIVGETLDQDCENLFIPLHDYQQQQEEGSSTPQTGNEDSLSDTPSTSLTRNANNQHSKKDSFDLEQHDMPLSLRFKSKSSLKRDSFLRKIFGNDLVKNLARKFGAVFSFLFNVLNYPLLMFMFVNMGMGVAVGNLLGKGIRIFNLLAHWIKGGVFLCVGLLSLARYCGFGKKNGWAWNKILISQDQMRQRSTLWSRLFTPQGTITMEGLESFLIFFYGSTNVFLEHLAGAGGAWTAKDLQHVSIAFMYIGSGLCGLLAEIKLNDWKYDHALQHTEGISSSEIYAGSPGYSPNPFPAFTIFWTGILMSQHAQASETSTTIHIQWGYLLSYGSFFRLLTFMLLFLVPNRNFEPSKPFTELITSFCLLCGGLIFMESTDQVIEALEYRGFTPMFSFNISVGFITLLMAWEMLLFLWKNWLQGRQNNMK